MKYLFIFFIPLVFLYSITFMPKDKYDHVAYAQGAITHKEILPYISGGKTPSLRDDYVMVINDKAESVSKTTYVKYAVGDNIKLTYYGRVNNKFISQKELVIISFALLIFQLILTPLIKGQ